MRWFKHMTTAKDNEVLSELLEIFGAEGYGVWWIILELIAAQMDKSNKCCARYSVKKWAKSCQVSSKKFKKIISFLSELGQISTEKCQKTEDFLIISCSKLLKFRDEYSKKSGQTPDKIQNKSVECPEQKQNTETEANIETDKKKKEKKKIYNPIKNKAEFIDNMPENLYLNFDDFTKDEIINMVDELVDYELRTGKGYKDYYAGLRTFLRNERKKRPNKVNSNDPHAEAKRLFGETECQQ